MQQARDRVKFGSVGEFDRLTCQDAKEVLYSDFIPAVVHFNVVPVQVDLMPRTRKHRTRKMISWVTSSVIGKHEDDIRVWNPETLHGPVPVQ